MSDTSFSGRDANGRFVTGNAGGPGRSAQSRERRDWRLLDRLGMAAGEKLIGMILERAHQGNLKAPRWCCGPSGQCGATGRSRSNVTPRGRGSARTIETRGAAAKRCR